MCLQAFWTSLCTKACTSSCRGATLLQYCLLRHSEFLHSIKTNPKPLPTDRALGNTWPGTLLTLSGWVRTKPGHSEGLQTVLAVGRTRLWQEGWRHLTLLTFKHKFRHQSRLSSRAPTKGTDYLKPCYFTSASQLAWESSTENALKSAEDVKNDAQRTHVTHHTLCLSRWYHPSLLALNREFTFCLSCWELVPATAATL